MNDTGLIDHHHLRCSQRPVWPGQAQELAHRTAVQFEHWKSEPLIHRKLSRVSIAIERNGYGADLFALIKRLHHVAAERLAMWATGYDKRRYRNFPAARFEQI